MSSFLSSLITVATGNDEMLQRKSTKSLPAYANRTLCTLVSTRSFKLTLVGAMDSISQYETGNFNGSSLQGLAYTVVFLADTILERMEGTK